MGRQILCLLRKRPQTLQSKDIWVQLGRRGLQPDDQSERVLQGVYLLAGVGGEGLDFVYVGRSKDIITRMSNHVAKMAFATTATEATTTLVYKLARQHSGSSPMFFQILQSEDATEVALTEAAWSAALESFCTREDFLALRRAHGLPNIGDSVKGANGK